MQVSKIHIVANNCSENERLPTSLGWSTRPNRLTTQSLLDIVQKVELATPGTFQYPVPSNDSSSNSSSPAKRAELDVKRAIHWGVSM